MQDDPNDIIDEDYPEASTRLIEGGRFGEYEGTLIDDCLSVVEQGKRLAALRAEPAPPQLFRSFCEFGDGKLQKREKNFGGYYSGGLGE
jgi:hypothetical protein